MPRVKKEIKEENKLWKVIFRFLGTEVSYSADTIERCIAQLEEKHMYKGRCAVRAEKDGKSSEIFLPALTKKILWNKVYRQILEKRLMMRLA